MILDIIIAIIIGGALIYGFRKGLLHALVFFLIIICGSLLALKFSGWLSTLISNAFHVSGRWLHLVAVVLIFAAVSILFSIAAKVVVKLLSATGINFFNRLGGALLYGVLGAYLVSLVLFYGYQYHVFTDETADNSCFFTPVYELSDEFAQTVGLLIPVMKDLFHDLSEIINGLPENPGDIPEHNFSPESDSLDTAPR